MKSLQVFIEQKFDASDSRQLRQHAENQTALKTLAEKVDTTNGRLRKAEVAIAVLRFAVFTIGGALLAIALQVVVTRLGG